MTVEPPAPPPLPSELDRLLRRLRLPYVRRAAPDVIATATAQRWEHAEVLRVLLTEDAAGRDQATISTRRRASGLPAGKTFDAWDQTASVIPSPRTRIRRSVARPVRTGLRTFISLACAASARVWNANERAV
ncbi:MAG: ATP-binding protein [Solirubrobacteraceae bacterium]